MNKNKLFTLTIITIIIMSFFSINILGATAVKPIKLEPTITIGKTIYTKQTDVRFGDTGSPVYKCTGGGCSTPEYFIPSIDGTFRRISIPSNGVSTTYLNPEGKTTEYISKSATSSLFNGKTYSLVGLKEASPSPVSIENTKPTQTKYLDPSIDVKEINNIIPYSDAKYGATEYDSNNVFDVTHHPQSISFMTGLTRTDIESKLKACTTPSCEITSKGLTITLNKLSDDNYDLSSISQTTSSGITKFTPSPDGLSLTKEFTSQDRKTTTTTTQQVKTFEGLGDVVEVTTNKQVVDKAAITSTKTIFKLNGETVNVEGSITASSLGDDNFFKSITTTGGKDNKGLTYLSSNGVVFTKYESTKVINGVLVTELTDLKKSEVTIGKYNNKGVAVKDTLFFIDASGVPQGTGVTKDQLTSGVVVVSSLFGPDKYYDKTTGELITVKKDAVSSTGSSEGRDLGSAPSGETTQTITTERLSESELTNAPIIQISSSGQIQKLVKEGDNVQSISTLQPDGSYRQDITYVTSFDVSGKFPGANEGSIDISAANKAGYYLDNELKWYKSESRSTSGAYCITCLVGFNTDSQSRSMIDNQGNTYLFDPTYKIITYPDGRVVKSDEFGKPIDIKLKPDDYFLYDKELTGQSFITSEGIQYNFNPETGRFDRSSWKIDAIDKTDEAARSDSEKALLKSNPPSMGVEEAFVKKGGNLGSTTYANILSFSLGTMTAMQSATSNANTAIGIVSLFNGGNTKSDWWASKSLKDMADAFSIDNYIEGLCEMNTKESSPSTSVYFSDGTMGLQLSAYKSRFVQKAFSCETDADCYSFFTNNITRCDIDEDSSNYNYCVKKSNPKERQDFNGNVYKATFMIEPSKKVIRDGQTASFAFYAHGKDGIKRIDLYADKNATNDKIKLKAGDSTFYLTRSSGIYILSSKEFDKICVHFDDLGVFTSEFEEIYEEINNGKSNIYCNNFKEEVSDYSPMGGMGFFSYGASNSDFDTNYNSPQITGNDLSQSEQKKIKDNSASTKDDPPLSGDVVGLW